MENTKCFYCSSKENLYKIRTNKSGISRFRCRKCNTEDKRKYRKTINGKLAVARARDNYLSKNPERRKAWTASAKLGNRPCEVCGFEKADKHHPDISKALDVMWLCRAHHKEAHRETVNM